MADRHDLTSGSVTGKLMRFFFPVLAGLLFQQLYNTADAFIVGRYVGDEALAAVGGSASVITGAIIGFFTGLNSGATVLIAQNYGARDEDGLQKVLHTSLLFCLAVGVAITVIGYFATPAMLGLLKNPEDIMAGSTLYLRIYFAGAAALLLNSLFQGAMQGTGDSVRPLIYLAVSCTANILLDLLFVAVFGMGIAGAAWASVISMFLAAGLSGTSLLVSKGACRIVLKKLRWDAGALKGILRIGLPGGMQGAMYSVSNLIIQSAVNTLGTAVVTSWTATGKLDGFYWSTVSAFGVALCAFVGQCWGAGKMDRMRQGIRSCLMISLVTTVCMSCVLLSVARPAYGLFLSDPGIIDGAIEIMWYFVPFYVFWTFVEILSAAFRGTGDTFKPMIIVTVGTCLFRVVWMFTVARIWHTVLSVSIVYAISWGITGAVMALYYKKYSRLARSVG